MSQNRSFDELLKAAEYHHDQYIKQLRLLHEATAKNAGNTSPPVTRMERSGSTPTASPALRAITFPPSDPAPPSISGPKRSLRPPSEPSPDTGQSAVSLPLDKKVPTTSVYEGITPESVADTDEFLPLTMSRQTTAKTASDIPMSYVVDPLQPESFSEHDLACHLEQLDDANSTTITALGDVWHKRHEMSPEHILDDFDVVEDPFMNTATYEVYEVGNQGTPEPKHTDNGDHEGEVLEASTVWETLRDVNASENAVGRMTILQEPSPLMLAAAHMTMKRHFDMDELFMHLVSTNINKGKTRAYMNRAYDPNPLRQRSFFFVFKYYTVVGEGLTPAPWQAYDARPPDRRSPDHIDITECSSVLALSLGGEPVQVAKRHVRRRGTAGQQGNIYKTFAPWHLLHLQSFPDDEHSMRSEDLKKTFYNGPYAFLDSLSAEYRDAVKRYTILNQMITKLITPPNQFMFDSKLRDKLLFEDKDFTYSRRYFWAYNTLGVINDGIKSMRAAYLDTFTKEFWAGCHATLWPHPNPNSAEGREYLARMEGPRQELDAAVRDLQEMYDKNSRTRDEVRSLREQLFSGSSVKESRRAIEQGDNIKILTSVSMIFLPLTFVTSIFGITTLTLTVDDWQFPVIMVSVCIPFFLLILILAVRKSTIAIDKYKDLFWRLLYYLHISSAATSTGAEQADRRRLRRFRRIQKETRQEGGPRPGILKRAQSGLHHHHHHNHHRDHHGAGRPSGLRRSQSGLQQQPQQQLHGGGGSDAEGAAGRWTIWSKIGVVSRLWSSGPGGKQNGVTGDTKEDRNHDGIV